MQHIILPIICMILVSYIDLERRFTQLDLFGSVHAEQQPIVTAHNRKGFTRSCCVLINTVEPL